MLATHWNKGYSRELQQSQARLGEWAVPLMGKTKFISTPGPLPSQCLLACPSWRALQRREGVGCTGARTKQSLPTSSSCAILPCPLWAYLCRWSRWYRNITISMQSLPEAGGLWIHGERASCVSVVGCAGEPRLFGSEYCREKAGGGKQRKMRESLPLSIFPFVLSLS